MSRASQAWAFAGIGIGIFTGAGVSLCKWLGGIMIGMLVGLVIALFGFIYARKLDEAARRELLERNALEECRGTCGTMVPKGFLWRLPQNMACGGHPVCYTCFIRTIGRPPHPRSGDHFAYRTAHEERAWVKAVDRAGRSVGVDVKATFAPPP